MTRVRDTLRRLALSSLPLLLLVSCASDGGVGGTGISSAVIDGNVAGVTSGAAARFVAGAATLEGIAVRVAGEDIETITDATGQFRLEGDFPSLTELQFVEAGGIISALEVYVPAGGEVTLVDIRLRVPGPLAQMLAQPNRIQVDFEGFVVGAADCDQTPVHFQVEDASEEPATFTVELTPETQFQNDDPDGTAGCSDLGRRRNVRVRGSMSWDGRVTADRVRLIRRTSRPALEPGR